MSLQLRVTALANAIATDVKALRTADGTLSALTTTAKTSLVAAINEIKAAIDGIDTSSVINDAAASLTTTYSSTKISADITAAVAAVVDASPGALDTLNELAAALGDDANFSATITAALSERVGISAQSFTAPQQAQARSNIGAAAAADLTTLQGTVSTLSSNTTNALAKRVAVDSSQSFTGAEQIQGRANIGAASQSDMTQAQSDIGTNSTAISTLSANIGNPETDFAAQYAATRDS
jgi:hypothetical protein